MKVRDLVSRTQWLPGGTTDRPSPRLSVLLPTFRRAADGMFQRAADSILGQSFEDLELIIVDDGSTDGTAGLIQALMARDHRVACLRHVENIGLPAVSEYEAYRRARGSVIGFGFDDFVFRPDAFGELLSFMDLHDASVAHGHVEMVQGSSPAFVMGRDLSHDSLLYHNVIANGSVLVRREVLEDIGLYDPHIALSRICDWDLWLRVYDSYRIREAPVAMGREFGESRADSLGSTYPMHLPVVQEFMAQQRNHLLRPAAFPDRDVWRIPEGVSSLLEDSIRRARPFFKGKVWYPAADEGRSASEDASGMGSDCPVAPGQRRRIISVVGHPDASLALCWVSDAGSPLRYLNFIVPQGDTWYERSQLLRSDGVVFCREILSAEQRQAIAFCRKHGIPHAYFVDDNFPVLTSEDAVWSEYTIERLREELASFSAVLVPSDTLGDSFRKQKLHDNVLTLQLVLNPSLLEKLRRIRGSRRAVDDELRCVYFGGGFRDESLLRNVVPALVRQPGRIRLLKRDSLHIDAPAIALASRPAMPRFHSFLEQWADFGADVVLHPHGATANIDYKTPNAILVSLYLGAVPVVADEKAYEGLDATLGVEKAGNTIDSWADAVSRLRSDDYRQEMLRRLRQYCTSRFIAEHNAACLDRVFSGIQPLTIAGAAARYRRALKATYEAPPPGNGATEATHTPDPSPDAETRLNCETAQDGAATDAGPALTVPQAAAADSSGAVASSRGSGRWWSLRGLPLRRKPRFLSNFEEILDGRMLKGWAHRSGREKPPELDLFIDDRLVCTFSAALYRDDLAALGIADGRRAFLLKVPNEFLDGAVHVFDIRFAGTKESLARLPQAIATGLAWRQAGRR